jgi:pimeloyl-ACP methyl ester carboxylesterase
VADYALANAVGDVAGILDTLGIEAAHVVGHDWGAAVAWLTAAFIPDRVNKLAVLSVGHPRAPRMPGTAPELPPVRVPTLGIWSTNDHYLDGERMEKSGAYVQAPSRYEVIEGASHWIPLDAPDRLNALLLDWLHGPAMAR